MPIEFYIKSADIDSDYNDKAFDIHDELDIYMNQIRNLFSAEAGVVMGASDMTVELEYLVYETGVDEIGLKEKIYEGLARYCTYSSRFQTNVDVKFSLGNERDICLIDITVETRNLKVLIK